MPAIHPELLSGRSLDYAVALALGLPIVASEHARYTLDGYSGDPAKGAPVFWALGIATVPSGADEWEAIHYGEDPADDMHAYGPTPLIAGLRCFVRSKLGESVDLPPELAPL